LQNVHRLPKPEGAVGSTRGPTHKGALPHAHRIYTEIGGVKTFFGVKQNNMPSSPETFFAELPNQGGVSRTLDFIYDTLDDWLLQGEGKKVDQVLDQVDVDTCEHVYLIGYLTITGNWRSHLTARTRFYERVKERIERDVPHRADALLKGLE
jgi:hypothetical protein